MISSFFLQVTLTSNDAGDLALRRKKAGVDTKGGKHEPHLTPSPLSSASLPQAGILMSRFLANCPCLAIQRLFFLTTRASVWVFILNLHEPPLLISSPPLLLPLFLFPQPHALTRWAEKRGVGGGRRAWPKESGIHKATWPASLLIHTLSQGLPASLNLFSDTEEGTLRPPGESSDKNLQSDRAALSHTHIQIQI